MKLYYDKRSKNPTYFIQQGIRNGKKTTTRNVKVIGKHNDLLAITDDPLAYAKEQVRLFNEEYASHKVTLNISIDFDKKVPFCDQKVSSYLSLNVGYFFLQTIYHQLHLDDFFYKVTSDSRIHFDPDLINRFLTFSRILFPASKRSTCAHLHHYFEQPDIHYHDCQRFLSILADHFDDYLAHLYKYSSQIIDIDTSVCYYDCTNYYFEIESPDDDYVDEVTGEVFPGFRKYGISKEHRPNPIVQMGLFMDRHGIPLSMSLNPGNQNEQLSAVPTEEKMMKSFKNKQLIYCADAGLGSCDIRRFNSFGSRAFIVTQSIKKLSDPLKEAVFNDCDYRLLSNDQPMSLETMKTFDRMDEKNLNLYNDKIYKVLPADKLVDLGLEETYLTQTGKERIRKAKGSLKQYVIIIFSRKSMEYQRAIREKQVERARKLITSNKVDKLGKNQNDPKRFIKKDKRSKDTYLLDEEKIAEESQYDGFYAIATNLDASEEARQIIEINSQRYMIEDCFRILKTNFRSRPAYEHTEEHIRGHFMTCYTALLIYKILEYKINHDNDGLHFTVTEIIEGLRNMNVMNCHDLYYQAIYGGSQLCTRLNEVFGLELDREYYEPKVLRKKLKNIL